MNTTEHPVKQPSYDVNDLKPSTVNVRLPHPSSTARFIIDQTTISLQEKFPHLQEEGTWDETVALVAAQAAKHYYNKVFLELHRMLMTAQINKELKQQGD